MSEEFSDRATRDETGGVRPTSAFGDVVRKLREARNLTQTTLAARMDQSVSYISLIESGRRKPTQRVITNLLSALDLSEAEKTELQVAAGLPTSPLDTAVQHCIAALEVEVGPDVFDRHLLRQDLTALLNGWKDAVYGRRAMESGQFDTARKAFTDIAEDSALTPMLLANAYIRLADLSEKQGQVNASEVFGQRAQAIAAQQNLTWARALRAEISGTQGFIAARAGQLHLAQVLTDRGTGDDKALKVASEQAGDTEAIIVARIGIANAYSRLALSALFSADAGRGMSYAQEGLSYLPAAPERDIARTRLRLQALEAWAYFQLKRYDDARALRLAILDEYEAMNDTYGVAKTRSYLADDNRSRVVELLGEHTAEVVTPEQRRARIAELRAGKQSARFRELLEDAIDTYQKAIDGLTPVGDLILLARARRNLGDLFRYRWLLDGNQADRDACERLLNVALDAEKQMYLGTGYPGRRLPNVYESLGLLAWDEGTLASARDNYQNALDALQKPGMTTTDPASENMLARLRQAIGLITTALGAMPEKRSADIAATRTIWRERPDDAGARERHWRNVTERLEQLVIPTLRALARDGAEPISDMSARWAKALYELEMQDGPRIMAQRELSAILLPRGPSSPPQEVRKWRERRREQLQANIETAHERYATPLYQDICSTRHVTESLCAAMDEHQEEHFEQAIDLLRRAGDTYHITHIAFDLPLGFAIKGKMLLIQAPEELAREQLGITLNEPCASVCFIIEDNASFMQHLNVIFSELRSIGEASELNGPDAAAWLLGTRQRGVAETSARTNM